MDAIDQLKQDDILTYKRKEAGESIAGLEDGKNYKSDSKDRANAMIALTEVGGIGHPRTITVRFVPGVPQEAGRLEREPS